MAGMSWEADGEWLIRQQQWGEPSSFPECRYAFEERGIIYALGELEARRVDQICIAGRQVALPLAA